MSAGALFADASPRGGDAAPSATPGKLSQATKPSPYGAASCHDGFSAYFKFFMPKQTSGGFNAIVEVIGFSIADACGAHDDGYCLLARLFINR